MFTLKSFAYKDPTKLRFTFCPGRFYISQRNLSFNILKACINPKTRGSQKVFKQNVKLSVFGSLYKQRIETYDLYFNQIVFKLEKKDYHSMFWPWQQGNESRNIEFMSVLQISYENEVK